MNGQPLAAVILAAGQGTRMKSLLPKVLHPVAGQPMICAPVRLCRELGCEKTVLVIGHGADQVQRTLENEPLLFALQEQQLGTGHALLCAENQLANFSGTLLLLCGDVPLLRRQTIERLLAYHAEQKSAVTVLTAEMDNPQGYGRVVRDGESVLRIVEEKDASTKEKTIHEINTGIYAFEAPLVFDALRAVGRDNAQGEYYLTDILEIARREGRTVRAVSVADPGEPMGINDRVQLAEASGILRRRINEEHMRAGVTLLDPAATYIDPQVVIDPDCVIHPGTHLRGSTRLGRHCIVEPGVIVTDCIIGDHAHLKAGSVLVESTLGPCCAIGPMAHLRPGTVLAGHNKLGNFVETKKAILAEKAQASHLTYLGDTEIGRNVNIGCGTITCNYDGVNKHKTVIEDDVFVGSDTQLVAPIRIGRNSLIAAGSTITKDVPPDSLALSRSEQKNIEGWRLRPKKTKE
jgi:bifunctional UDP-N-acetylglucosamine pyrophosphorylase / glucosamine-1-phosphate N-acetyltransferase